MCDRPGPTSNPRGNAPPSLENQLQPFPRGTILRGVLREIVKPPEPEIRDEYDDDTKARIRGEWKDKWVYVVDVKPSVDGHIDWDAPGKLQAFARAPAADEVETEREIVRCHYVLYDFDNQKLVSATVYLCYADAVEDAQGLDNVLIVPLDLEQKETEI